MVFSTCATFVEWASQLAHNYYPLFFRIIDIFVVIVSPRFLLFYD